MQTQLIKLVKKGSSQVLEVCKEGLLILRRYKHRKLRIVFNVIHLSSKTNLDHFNCLFLSHPPSLTNNQLHYQSATLTIFNQFEDLSDQRTVLIFNAYQQKNKPPLLSIIGYLAASVFIYHNEGDLSSQCELTSLLSLFRNILSNTNIDCLDEQIKYKSGFSKKPYLLCLIPTCPTNNPTNYFRQIYTYKQTNSNQLNNAIDVILDYFPERSAVLLANDRQHQINQMGQQFIKEVLGRQLFGFQITGLTMQNLCFELTEALATHQKIDLLQIYTKVISNQKYRVQCTSLQKYNTILQQIKIKLPISHHQLFQQHYSLCQEVIAQSILNAKNCMQFTQFINVYYSIKEKMQKGLKYLQEENNQKANDLNNQTYNLLQDLDLQHFQIENAEDILKLFHHHLNKLQLFQQQSVGETKDTFLIRLLQKHGQDMINIIIRHLQSLYLNNRQLKLNLQQLKLQNRIFKQQNKKIRQEYQLQNDVINGYKKIQNSNQNLEPIRNVKQVQELKKKIQELQEQLSIKNIQIDQIYALLENFQGVLEKGKSKHKFSKEIIDSTKQISDLVSKFYQMLDQVGRLEDREKQFAQIFQNQKKNILSQVNNNQTKIATIQSDLDRVCRQKASLQQIINEANQGIKVMKQVEDQFKATINALEKRSGTLSCLLAETQAQLQLHIKAVNLLVQHIVKGKSENLNKFIKVLKNQDLKETLKLVVKK